MCNNTLYVLVKYSLRLQHVCDLNLLFLFIGTVLQKTRELFNISTTNECRLWHWNMGYDTLSDLEETVAGVYSSEKEDNVYTMVECVLNNQMVIVII